jgi:catechol 2,3-dioxygenase-like lactoylglutathione lyase family enzyme
MIGRMHHVVLDCQDPTALATFYSALLGLPVTYRDDDWVVVARDDTSSGLAFQRAPGTGRQPGQIPRCRSRSTSTSWSRTPTPRARGC